MSPTPNERWKPTSDEEDAQHKFMRKARDEPFIPIGKLTSLPEVTYARLCFDFQSGPVEVYFDV